MKAKCIIVDDERPAREVLTEYVSRLEALELCGTCKNALEANRLLQKDKVDLVFLDINMPELTGVDWVKSLSDPPKIIFTTAYREYAADGFEVEAVDYLVKPISFQRFLKACNKALTHLETEIEDFFFIKADQQYVKIFFDDILYIEGLKDYVAIHTEQRKHLALISLKNVEQRLPRHRFMRIHRSTIVSLNQISAIEGNTVKVKGTTLTVSQKISSQLYDLLVKNKLWKRKSET